MDYKEPVIIAEIGCNHMGDIDIARKMIRMAADFCEVEYVKFQKRTPRELLSEEQFNNPHPNIHNSYGGTYGAHREYLEFDIEQHRELKIYCEEMGVKYCCSVWDVTSARQIAELQPAYIKIPSASNLHFKMLDILCKEYEGELHISLGMTTNGEKNAIVEFFDGKKAIKRLVLYHTTSGYPVPFEDLHLMELQNLIRDFEGRVRGFGYSGHHKGIFADVVAYTLGAEFIERHFTLDRTWKGSDHAASLEPDGLRKVTRDLKNTQKTLMKKEKEILDIEIPQREKLKWRKKM